MDWPGDIFSIVLAVVLGAAIGIEREFSGKAAGLRTNVLICLGAAAFTIISKRMAGGDDSLTRIAAQVVTGVGFLGAGAIIQDRGGVHGLTTAATIWFVASLGMACGGRFVRTGSYIDSPCNFRSDRPSANAKTSETSYRETQAESRF